MANKKRDYGYRYPIPVERDFIIGFSDWCRDRGYTMTACFKAALWLFMTENRSPSEVIEPKAKNVHPAK